MHYLVAAAGPAALAAHVLPLEAPAPQQPAAQPPGQAQQPQLLGGAGSFQRYSPVPAGGAATGAAAGEGMPPPPPKQEPAEAHPEQPAAASPGLLLRLLQQAVPLEAAQMAGLLPLLPVAAAASAVKGAAAGDRSDASPASPPEPAPAGAAAAGTIAAQPPSVPPPTTASPRPSALQGLVPLADMSLPPGSLATLLARLG